MPSIARRILVGLARLGIDLGSMLHRARDAILRPVRLELAAARAAWRKQLAGAVERQHANIEQQTQALRVEIQEQARTLAKVQDEANALQQLFSDVQRDFADLRTTNEILSKDLMAGLARVEATHHTSNQLDRRLADIADRLENERSERRLRIATLETFITADPILGSPAIEQQFNSTSSPIVSVILPTRNRAHCISDAIASVRAQRFTSWELIIVDDGSADGTAAVVEPFLVDTRIRCLEQSAQGASAARNHGLKVARGPLIAYIDSDNVWYPDFLTAAVNAFAADPTTSLFYGMLVTDSHHLDGTRLLWLPFDRTRLMASNFIDLNVVVHRRTLVDHYGGFDETLERVIDWDLLLRYTEHIPARPLPVLAARYRTCDDIRITTTVPYGPSAFAIKRKWYPDTRMKRALRVLYALPQYPQLSGRRIATEIRCMLRWGAHIEVWRKTPSPLPCSESIPIYDVSLEEAVRRAKPDVIHVDGLDLAWSQKGTLGQLRVPVSLRAQAFEVVGHELRLLLDRPWVRAIYVFPNQLNAIIRPDPRLRAVPTAFDTTLFQPSARKDHNLVISVGTAIPGADLPFLLELAKRVPTHRFVLFAATCGDMKAYADELREIHRNMNSRVELFFDVSFNEVVRLMHQAGVYLHTSRPPKSERDALIGMPTCIAEAMATGAHILVREVSELAAFVGNAGTTYRNVEHATDIITRIAAWPEEAWSRAAIASTDRAFVNYADEIALRPMFDDWCATIS